MRYALILILLLAGCAATPTAPIDRTAEQRKAVSQAVGLLIDAHGPSTICSDGFIGELVRFYKYGTGTAMAPGNPAVTRTFCRRVVIRILYTLHQQCPDKCAPILLDFATTAETDLDYPLRMELYEAAKAYARER